MTDPPLTIIADDRAFATTATVEGARLTEHDIRSHELVRVRRALAYLKLKVGDDAMRRLLADDTAAMTATARGWVEASAGRWRSAEITLALPGPGAAAFRDWYPRGVAERRSAAMRAGHPEHYLNTPGPGGIEVIEPIGETDLPWRILYRTLDPTGELPAAWPPGFPVRFAAEIVDGDGVGGRQPAGGEQEDLLSVTCADPTSRAIRLYHRSFIRRPIEASTRNVRIDDS